MSGITKQEMMNGVVPNKKIDKPKSKYTKAQLFEIIEELEQEAEWWGEIKDDLTDDNEKLKLKEEVKHLNKCIDSIRDQYLEQKQENVDLKESYKYGTLGKNGVHIQLNKQGDNYYCHNTAMLIEKLKEENEKLKGGMGYSQDMWCDLQEQLDKEKTKSFNLEHQLQMVKDSSEYNEYQELFKKKQELSQELLSLKNSKNSTSAKHLKTEKENEKLKEENLKLENEVERLSFVKKSYLDDNLKHSKKELISMLKQSYDNINELHKKLIVNMKQKESVEHIMRMISWMSHDCGDPIHPISYGTISYPDSVDDLDVNDFNKYAEVMGFNINC
jgi:hypothetical protein